MTIVLFWMSLAVIVYVYAGYPLIAWLRGRIFARLCASAPIEPRVTVIVVAHNEGHRITERIENLLASDYPRQKLQIIIASDGSTDDTAARAARFTSDTVKVCAFCDRRGKAAVLNDLIPTAKGEVVVLADARQWFEPAAIRNLVSMFVDPRVGAVSGELMAPGLYWKYEKFIRASESRAGSTVGATGAIYAIRRILFRPIPEDTILDDVVIPVRIARKGYRVLFEGEARAHDVCAPPEAEFTRKSRTIAGTFQLLVRESWLLNPFRSPLWFESLSHKALRLTLPLLHAALLIANVVLVVGRTNVGRALSDPALYVGLLSAQVAFYAAAVVGRILSRTRLRFAGITVPYTMCLMLWATIVGFSRFVTRKQQVTWDIALTSSLQQSRRSTA